jgi:hypothetical protein
MIAVSIVVLGLVGVLDAAEPCKTPEQWEAITYESYLESGINTVIKVSYDATNTRVRAVGTTTNTRTKRYKRQIWTAWGMFSDCSLICRIGEAILRYDEDKFYFIDWTSMTCKVTPAEGEFEPAGVPDNATFLGGITFGLEGALTVNNFLLSRKVVTPSKLDI